MTEPTTVPSAVREQLLTAIDGTRVPPLGYESKAALLAAYDASRTQTVDDSALSVAEARDRLRGMALTLATGEGPLVEPWAFNQALDDYQAAVAAAVLPATTNHDTDTSAELETARATNQRLNREKQRLESELATYRRAVAQWEINERGTYIPHSSLRAIGLASGRDILGSVRHLKHFERVEEAEEANEQLRAERAAALHEAADRAEIVALRLRLKNDYGAANGAHEVTTELRRVADETAATETQPDRAATETQAAPASDRNSGPGWYEVITPRATTCIAYVHEDGSLYLPEGDLSQEEFAFAAARGMAHRLVRADEQSAAGARQDGAQR